MSTPVKQKSPSNHFITKDLDVTTLIAYANSKLTMRNPRNYFKDIRTDILTIYLIYLLMGFGIDNETALSTSLLIAIVLAFALDQTSNKITKFATPLGVLFISSLPFMTSYTRNFRQYIPQLILVTTGNTTIAIFFQILTFIFTFFLMKEDCSIKNFQFSFTCFMLLLLVQKLIQAKSLETEKLRAQNDSLKAQVQNLEARVQEEANFHKKFILSLSNEFLNPLNSIIGNIELIQKNVSETDEGYNQLKMAKLGCETLLHFLKNILDFSKAENNELDIHYTSCSIRKTLEKSWMLFRELLKQKNLKGELYLHKNSPTLLMIDPNRLHQILLNLVTNSLKLTTRGFVRIVISWHPFDPDQDDRFSRSRHYLHRTSSHGNRSPVIGKNKVECDINSPKFGIGGNYEAGEESLGSIELPDTILFSPSLNYFQLDMKNNKFPKGRHQKLYNLDDQPYGFLKIQVIDSGPGIPSSVMQTLFEKFSKFNPEPNNRVEGGGVSLWITRKLCQKMDGDIRVFSEPQKGSTFLAFIKAEISPQSIGTPTPSPYVQNTRRTKLLSMRNMSFLALPKKEQIVQNVVPEVKKEEEYKLKSIVADEVAYNQQLNKQFLEVCEVEVKCIASNGLEVYAEYTKNSKPQIDLIFLDIDMPVMDGKVCCAKIREYEKTNKINPVIIVILTGNCTENELKQCLDKRGNIRANYFYRKPMSLMDCQNLIKLIKREKNKKSGSTIQNLTVFSNYTLIYEKNLIQQVLLENYLRVGLIKHKFTSKKDIVKYFLTNSENINSILYNCEDDENECIEFVTEIQNAIRTKNLRRIPLFGIVEIVDTAKMEALKKAGFKSFLMKPFDYENVAKLLTYPMLQANNN